MRPWLSVAGTRWTRWTPDSYFIWPNTSLPFSANVTSRKPPAVPSEASMISIFQPCVAAYFW